MSSVFLLHHALSSMAATKFIIPMATANFIMCNTCNCPYGANNNNMAGLDNLCYDCENMTDEDDY